MSPDTTFESDLSLEEIIATISVLLLAGFFILFYLWPTAPEVQLSAETPTMQIVAGSTTQTGTEHRSETMTPARTEATTSPVTSLENEDSRLSYSNATDPKTSADPVSYQQAQADPATEIMLADTGEQTTMAAAETPTVASSSIGNADVPSSIAAAELAPFNEAIISAVEHDLANGTLTIQGSATSANQQIILSINGKETKPFHSDDGKIWQHSMAVVPGEYYIRIIELNANTGDQPLPAIYNISVSQEENTPHTLISLLTGEFYKVQASDSLAHIADKFAVDGARLIEVNGLPDKNTLKTNDILFIPR